MLRRNVFWTSAIPFFASDEYSPSLILVVGKNLFNAINI